ncbi:MAG TPA: hypothetical protein VLU25_04740 [Acidobacteriota bacterium]|nr:hypothetical protein [Acidobacteriota bacterium]
MKLGILIGLTALGLAAGALPAQERTFSMQAPQGERMMLPGLILYFSDHEETGEVQLSTVLNIAQQTGGPATEYSQLDLKQGDVLMMVDAQPVSSAEAFIKAYQEMESGTEISLGLRSETGEVKVVSFKKPDASELPQMRMMRKEDLTPEQLEQLKKNGKVIINKPEKAPPPGGLR